MAIDTLSVVIPGHDLYQGSHPKIKRPVEKWLLLQLWSKKY